MDELHAHFYLDSDFDISSVFDWDPDNEPERFASGLGHNFLELFVRLRKLGHPVSIGPNVPPETRVIVVFPGREIWNFRHHWSLGWAVRRHECLILRSDLHMRYGRIVANALHIVANARIVDEERRIRVAYLPPLPQRGLRPRREHSPDMNLVLVYKGNPTNVPEYLKQQSFLSSLTALGVELVLDAPMLTDGSDQSWHDFSQADLVLLDRANRTLTHTRNKPPTKLLNAWYADGIPLYAAEPAYLCLADPGLDSLPFDGPQELLALLGRLNDEPELLDRLRAGVRQRRMSLPSTQDVVESYWAAIQSQASRPSTLRAITAVPLLVPMLIHVRLLRVLDRVRNLHHRGLRS